MIFTYLFGIVPAILSWILAALFLVPFAVTKKEYFRKIAISFDQLANAFLDGDEDETPSSRMGRKLAGGNTGCCKWRYYLCKLLSVLDPTSKNHCLDARGE